MLRVVARRVWSIVYLSMVFGSTSGQAFQVAASPQAELQDRKWFSLRLEADPRRHASPIHSKLGNQARDYYYAEYASHLKVGIPDSGFGSLKALLHHILDSAHMQNRNSPDRLVPDCRHEKGGSCLQQKIFTYLAARKILFGVEGLFLQRGKMGYEVQELYCGRPYGPLEFAAFPDQPGEYKIPSHEILNTEHLWPQSRFNKSGIKYPVAMQKSDLHHLFPSDHRYNGVRSSYQFGEVSVDVDFVVDEDFVPTCVGNRLGFASKGEDIFYEPPDAVKGNIARALFYFSLRYEISIAAAEESFLRHWHEVDPVDLVESEQHELKYQIQGNRNPFIDYPHLVANILDF